MIRNASSLEVDLQKNNVTMNENIQSTIDEYAKTVHSFDDTLSMRSYGTNRIKNRGSKAVLSALRALQNKIASMNQENAECKQKYGGQLNRLNRENKSLKEENAKSKAQIKQLMKLNQTLTTKIKFSSQKEEKALQIAQNAEHKLQENETKGNTKIQSLQKQIEKLQNKSLQKKQVKDALKVYVQHIEKSKVNISILKDEIIRERQLKQSILKRKAKCDKLISEMIKENEKLHSKILNLQRAQLTHRKRKQTIASCNDLRDDINSITIMLSPRTAKNKIKRSKSAHSMKRKQKRPFLPTGKINKTFSKMKYSSTRRKRNKNKPKIRSRSRTYKSKKIKSLPKSSLKLNETYEMESDNDEYIQHLLDMHHPHTVFDGIGIDDIKLLSL